MPGQSETKNHQFLWRYLKPYLRATIFASLLGIPLAFISTILSILMGPGIMVLVEGGKPQALDLKTTFGDKFPILFEWFPQYSLIPAHQVFLVIPLSLVVIAATRAILRLISWYLWERTGEEISRDIRQNLMNAYVYHSTSGMNASSPEEVKISSSLAGLISYDVKVFREYIVRFYGSVPREFLQVVFMGISLFLISAKLSLLFFLFVLPMVVIVGRLGKKIRRRADKALRDYSSLSEWIQQRLLGVETIKHYKTEELEIKKMQDLTEGLFQKFYSALRVKARTSPLLEFLAVMGFSAVFYIALDDVHQNKLSGEIVMSFLSTLAFLSQSASRVGKYVNSSREGAAASQRLKKAFDRLSHSAIKDYTNQLESQDHRLTADGLSLAYQNDDIVINNLSYLFERRKIYALFGPSGAGKTTLFKSIIGQLPPRTGKISYHKRKERLPFTLVPQEILLAPDTLEHNITYPDTNVDADRLAEAMKKVGLEEVVSSLQDGLQTKVGDGGQELSGGQSQRVMLARLFYHQSELILIDEGTSALDPKLEQLFFDSLKKLKNEGSTIIIIAHRPTILNTADTILFMEKGRIVEEGGFTQLKKNVRFQQLIGSH